jgi:mRNA interferase MazF
MMARRGEVWWADLDPVVGRELGRKIRPVLVISTDAMNEGPSEKLIVVPSTTRGRGAPSEISFTVRTAQGPRTSYFCCEDVRGISVARLRGRMAPTPVPGPVLERVEQALRVLMEL